MTLSLMAGTYPGATWSAQTQHGVHWIPLHVGQHWIDDDRLLLDLVDTETMSLTARIEASGNDDHGWTGTMTRGERSVPIACRQD